MTDPLAPVAHALAALPEGTSTGRAGQRRYIATKSIFNAGRSVKLVAEALDGSDYISTNFYALASGYRLYPCEMRADKVTAFILSYAPDDDAG